MGVNVTTLLVLTTLFIGVSNTLPRTSYIKMIDIWLIASTMIPFLEVILHTMMNKLHNEEDNENEVTLFQKSNSRQEQRNQNGNKMKMSKKISQQKRKMLVRTLEILGIVVLPILYILFCIIFFTIGNLEFQFE